MKTELLNYELPAELIAQKPADIRSQSRLLVMQRKTGTVYDRSFSDIIEYIDADDCLVLNDTKVIPARFFARRKSGAKLEGLLLSLDKTQNWRIMMKNARRVKTGETILLCGKDGEDFCQAEILDCIGYGQWRLDVRTDDDADTVLEKIGFAPLPPYIKRDRDKECARTDLNRYQTVYAQAPGAVAAPTAGLHFTKELLTELQNKGVQLAYITLHVGTGTFKPVTAEKLADHQIHEEEFSISQKDADIINNCRQKGGKIVAVGTTSVRTLETADHEGKIRPAEGTTKLFIQPGYEFKIVDAMVTNFHLPKSTLLALVGAFAGLENILAAYRHAIEQRYRFYSYGDAMLIM